MAGDVDAVTAVLARAPAPVSSAAKPSPAAERTGNGVAVSGESLPRSAPPERTVDLEAIARRLNEIMADRQRSLSFHVDEASGRTVITVRDATTHQVVRQIPSPEVLAFAHALEQGRALVDALI